MKFRTEVEKPRPLQWLEPQTPVTLLGSCFADNVGQRLVRDGFDTIHNPLGPLYNPMSLARCLQAALDGYRYTSADLVAGPRGHHCLDYASRYSGDNPDRLCEEINDIITRLGERLRRPEPQILCLTFGSAWHFLLDGKKPVGNCHKFPSQRFERRLLKTDEIAGTWAELLRELPGNIRTVFTVSPIRHLADGLHGNSISKATLLLATESITAQSECPAIYFPAFEIMNDDLRDYRFYADDLKHPTPMAADYIYEIFQTMFMTSAAMEHAAGCRRAAAAAAHKTILTQQ